MDEQSIKRVKAHLVCMERQLEINKSYFIEAGCSDTLVRMGNSHIQDAIDNIKKELQGTVTHPEPCFLEDSPLFINRKD